MIVTRTLVQVVPALSPPATGVGDYAVGLAERLKATHGIDTVFLVCRPGWRSRGREGTFAVRTLRERSACALQDELEAISDLPDGSLHAQRRSILLQLSPYGYEDNGCPFWLARGLRSWIEREPGKRRLVTMFHELYASGPPWTKAFWVRELQKVVLRSILGCTSVAMTNTRMFAHVLERWGGVRDGGIRCLPTPSNVGEPAVVPSIESRSRRVCVFGIAPGQHRLSEYAAGCLRQIVRSWPVEEITLVGDTPIPRTFEPLGCRVVCLREFEPEAVSNVLLDSILGLSWYPAEFLGKSGVYAAYCAHGVPTLLVGAAANGRSPVDGIDSGKHYIYAASASKRWNPALLQQIADNARTWYSTHGLAVHARTVFNCVLELSHL